MPMLTAFLMLLSLCQQSTPVDFAKVPRAIEKQPTFVSSKPLYGLFLFGEKRDARVWAVLDQSRKDKPEYDVLYLDLEADGDLTQPSNRIAGTLAKNVIEESTEPWYTFQVSTLNVGAERHTNFGIGASGSTFQFSIMWKGKTTWAGPFAPNTGLAAKLGDSPASAPILVPGGVGPFQFELWASDKLKRGDEENIKVFVGNAGSVRGAFCSPANWILPKEEFVTIELVYTDKNDKQQILLVDLKERC